MSALPARPLETALHIRVAEALGWSQIGPGNSMNMGDPGIGYPPVNAIVGRKQEIPRYDTDWSATGPLIEKYGIGTSFHYGRRPGEVWEAQYFDYTRDVLTTDCGQAALVAVCNLILALKEAGKL